MEAGEVLPVGRPVPPAPRVREAQPARGQFDRAARVRVRIQVRGDRIPTVRPRATGGIRLAVTQDQDQGPVTLLVGGPVTLPGVVPVPALVHLPRARVMRAVPEAGKVEDLEEPPAPGTVRDGRRMKDDPAPVRDGRPDAVRGSIRTPGRGTTAAVRDGPRQSGIRVRIRTSIETR